MHDVATFTGVLSRARTLPRTNAPHGTSRMFKRRAWLVCRLGGLLAYSRLRLSAQSTFLQRASLDVVLACLVVGTTCLLAMA